MLGHLINESFHKGTIFNQRPSHVYIRIPVEVKFILLIVVVRVLVRTTVFLNDGNDNRNPKAFLLLGFVEVCGLLAVG